VAKADEYRQYAQECMDSARVATNEAMRRQFMELAQLWLETAAKIEAGVEQGRVDGPETEPFAYRPAQKPAAK
jgi:hypothetical protein